VSERRSPPPRIALRPDEAAESLGVSRSFFYAEVMPELRQVRRGRVRLIPLRELDAWAERNAARYLPGEDEL
jgi:excisionase family DNA binding protein